MVEAIVAHLLWETHASTEFDKRPDLPDWYVYFELVPDYGVDFFTLARLPAEPWIVEISLEWALIRREANAAVDKLRSEYQEHEAQMQRLIQSNQHHLH